MDTAYINFGSGLTPRPTREEYLHPERLIQRRTTLEWLLLQEREWRDTYDDRLDQKTVADFLDNRYHGRGNMHILEVASGDSAESARVLSGNDNVYLSLDINSVALRIQRERLALIDATLKLSPVVPAAQIAGSFFKLPLHDEVIDLIIAINAIPQLDTEERLLAEIREMGRVSKPGAETVIFPFFQLPVPPEVTEEFWNTFEFVTEHQKPFRGNIVVARKK